MDPINNNSEFRTQPPVQVVTKTRIWPIILAALLAAIATFTGCFFVFFAL